MKIATFLITWEAMKIIFGAVCKEAPIAWFNFTIADGTLSRFKIVEKITPEILQTWLAVVRLHDCEAVPMLTSDEDRHTDFYGTDSGKDYLPIIVDIYDEIDLWRMRWDISTPDNPYLARSALFAYGGRIPMNCFTALEHIWQAYADGLRTWTREPAARKWLADLKVKDFTPLSPELRLTPEEFKIPEFVTPDQLELGYFPAIYNPAFAVGFRGGQVTTFGACRADNEWSFDESGAIRAQLETLKTSILLTA